MLFIAVMEAGGKRQLINISLVETVTYGNDGKTSLHIMDYNGDTAVHILEMTRDQFERALDKCGVKILECDRARR